MMIEYRSGDIFGQDAEALVNAVNCVGVMGRGIALRFKKAFAKNFKAYAAACKAREVQPGKMFVFETGLLTSPRFIINFPTKRHWRDKSRMTDIEAGLGALAEEIRAREIRSIALPALGSGLGGLEWSEVQSRIGSALGELADVRITVFEPLLDLASHANSAPNPRMTVDRRLQELRRAGRIENRGHRATPEWVLTGSDSREGEP